ncbi:hypothetical protein [Sporosarcina sp. ACRSL]|uniref:hypothetical protein n=1 Tax=Sporosarcina sp. ACRSL TaxID=2918215 RepID=UPI001EF46868|nr:hypothetical protein [Sporosarcina sp. ACRSL]
MSGDNVGVSGDNSDLSGDKRCASGDNNDLSGDKLFLAWKIGGFVMEFSIENA